MKLTVIHIVGAASCRRLCLTELKKTIGGAHVLFNYQCLLNADKNKPAEAIFTDWIRNHVKDKSLVLTTGLPFVQAKHWFKKTYPEKRIQHIIWEIHHNELSEKLIVKERSQRLLFNGILNHAKKALQQGFKPTHQFLKYTPLRAAMEFEMKKDQDQNLNTLLKKMGRQQTSSNKMRLKTSIVCEEAFDPECRQKGIMQIQELLQRHKFQPLLVY